MRVLRTACLVAVMVVSAECSQSDARTDRADRSTHTATFATELSPLDSVTPDAPATDPIVRVSTLEFGPNSEFLVADVSQGNVKVFDRGGTLKRTIGRKGEGPEEFKNPRWARFYLGDTIVVADQGLSRLTFVPATGEPRTLILGALSNTSSFDVLPSGDLITVGPSMKQEEAVVVWSPIGIKKSSYLPITQTVPRGQKPGIHWMPIRAFYGRVADSTLYVVSTVSDSLWILDFRTGTSSVTAIDPVGIEWPRPPQTPLKGIKDISAWSKSFYTTAPPVVLSSGAIIVPFVKGVLNYGDSMVVAVRRPGTEWTFFPTTVPLIATHGDTIASISDPSAEKLAFRFYSLRGH